MAEDDGAVPPCWSIVVVTAAAAEDDAELLVGPGAPIPPRSSSSLLEYDDGVGVGVDVGER